MTPQQAITALSNAGYSETAIRRELKRYGVVCSQSTINRIKHGSVSYSWDKGDAIVKLAKELLPPPVFLEGEAAA